MLGNYTRVKLCTKTALIFSRLALFLFIIKIIDTRARARIVCMYSFCAMNKYYLLALCTFSIAIVLIGTITAASITPSVARSCMIK